MKYMRKIYFFFVSNTDGTVDLKPEGNQLAGKAAQPPAMFGP